MSFGMPKMYSVESLASHLTAAGDGSLCVHVNTTLSLGQGLT